MLLLSSLLLAGAASAVSSSVTLDYATYVGTSEQSSGVTSWKGMRYAAPPVGNLRFRQPQDPQKQSGAIQANQFAPGCLEVNGTPGNYSEDCLFLNVFAPSNATANSKLPVWFYIHGGGFAVNANSKLDGTKLIQAASYDMVIVTLNYRLGPFGFLDGKEVQANGNSNNALRDQLKAMNWTQKYISKFGGDPSHIVLGGESAGAQSVALQLTAYGGTETAPFVGAIAQSVGTPPLFKTANVQFLYDAFSNALNCSSQDDSLSCLRNRTANEIQAINKRTLTKFPGASQSPLYLWSATVDGKLVPDYTYNLFNNDRFYKVPVLMGADRNDGRTFIAKPKDNYAQCNTSLKNNFPGLTPSNLNKIYSFYPLSDFPHYSDAGNSSYWAVCSQAYGDLRYKCPAVNFVASMASSGLTAWEYEYRVTSDDAEQGTPHTIEVNAIWDQPNGDTSSYAPGGKNADIVPEMQAYWSSFIRTLNPNTYKRSKDPSWTQWGTSSQIIYLQTNHTKVQTRNAHDQEICKYDLSIGPSLQQ